MPPLPQDLLALGLLAALLLLPGLAVVAAPWPVAPFLSLAFWLASWSWLLALGGSRETFVRLALLFFAALAALRLLKPLPWSRLSAASALVLVLGLMALGSFRALPLAAHPQASEQALVARLLVARDGWPATRAPFEPARPFKGVDGLSLVAADVALLTGAPVWRAALIVGLAAPGLLAVASLFVLRRVRPDVPADLPAALVFGLVLLGLRGLDPACILSAASAVVGVGLLARGTTRAPAVAAGACLAAAALFNPPVGLTALALAGAVVASRGSGGAPTGALRARLVVAVLAWAAFVGPAVSRVDPRGWIQGPVVLTGLALAALAAWLLARAARGHPRLCLSAGALLGTGALALGLAHARAAQPLGEPALHALSCLRDKGEPTDTLCASSAALEAWAPSVSDHAVSVATSARPCRFRYGSGGPERASVCTAGAVQIVEEP